MSFQQGSDTYAFIHSCLLHFLPRHSVTYQPRCLSVKMGIFWREDRAMVWRRIHKVGGWRQCVFAHLRREKDRRDGQVERWGFVLKVRKKETGAEEDRIRRREGERGSSISISGVRSWRNRADLLCHRCLWNQGLSSSLSSNTITIKCSNNNILLCVSILRWNDHLPPRFPVVVEALPLFILAGIKSLLPLLSCFSPVGALFYLFSI